VRTGRVNYGFHGEDIMAAVGSRREVAGG
jgi:hypothetical protein